MATKPETDLNIAFDFSDEQNEYSGNNDRLWGDSPQFKLSSFDNPFGTNFGYDNQNGFLFGSGATPKGLLSGYPNITFDPEKGAEVEKIIPPVPSQGSPKDEDGDEGLKFVLKYDPETPKSPLNPEVQIPEQQVETFSPVNKTNQESLATLPSILKNKPSQISKRGKLGVRNLALRADVMNKNIFRALRRECKTMFDAYLSENLFTNSRSKRIFKANLRRFSEHLLEITQVDFLRRSDFDSSIFVKYLGVFLNICLMKKVVEEEKDQFKIEEFNDLLYSYSHKKFYDYISIPEVSVLLKIVFEQNGIAGFVRKHPTLTVHQENYMKHIKKIMQHI